MSDRQINVQVSEELNTCVSEEWVRHVAMRTLDMQAVEGSQAVSLLVTDDQTVRRLNREYRGLDEETDVLSFSFQHWGEYYGEGEPPTSQEDVPFVLPPGESDRLGEVVISYPQAVRQARDSGHPTEKEMALLIAHGILHLLGYDHGDTKEAKVMRDIETCILAHVRG